MTLSTIAWPSSAEAPFGSPITPRFARRSSSVRQGKLTPRSKIMLARCARSVALPADAINWRRTRCGAMASITEVSSLPA
jgi:hypothetical protein